LYDEEEEHMKKYLISAAGLLMLVALAWGTSASFPWGP